MHCLRWLLLTHTDCSPENQHKIHNDSARKSNTQAPAIAAGACMPLLRALPEDFYSELNRIRFKR
jgi:hypothetical protein